MESSVSTGSKSPMDHNNEEKTVINRFVLDKETDARVHLSRSVYRNPSKRDHEETTITFACLRRKCRSVASEYCRVQTFYRAVVSLFPVLTWLPAYQWKEDLLPDFLAGLTVGIMSIPQGMAYARLAGIPPIYGLYTNIIPTFVYFLLGTTKHAAIGPTTVLSLIMSSIQYKHIPCQDCWTHPLNVSNLTANNQTASADVLTPIELGSAVAFMAGAFMILMGLFRLSFISDYLPDQLVGGFTVAAAVQVFAGQLQSIFGVTIPNRGEVGKVIMNFIDLFSVITHTNAATFIVFLVCFVFLLFSKYVINPFFQPKLKLPFPGEFIVMVAATLTSYFGRLYQNYNVSIVQRIPAGLPTPTVPKMSVMGMIAADSFVLAIVTYSYSISLAKLYAKRNGYKIRSIQEFYAYGFMNFTGSFFQCFNCGQSVARSLVYQMAGARSQLCGMFGSLVVIATVLFIAPFLESLPNAALAAIIVAAVMEMLRNLRELPALFRRSKPDFGIYVVTLVSVVMLDVTYGLAVSVAFALITIILRSQRSRVESGNDEVQLLYVSDHHHDALPTINDIDQQRFLRKVLVLRPTSSIFYANADKVKQHLLEKSMVVFGHRMPTLDGIVPLEKAADGLPTVIILDMTSVPFMDLMGVNALKEVLCRLKEKGVELYLCGCTDSVEELMHKTGFPDSADVSLFPSMLDAISFARFRLSDKWPALEKRMDTHPRN